MRRLFLLVAALALAACAPQALYFHETTKVAFAATYNTADSQPLSSTFGFKRRIVAVVPAQDRVSLDGSERTATNEKEALSIVSKFHVRVGTFDEGVVITNNFASGTAARVMTRSPGSAATLNALLHNELHRKSAGDRRRATARLRRRSRSANQRIRKRLPAEGARAGGSIPGKGASTRSARRAPGSHSGRRRNRANLDTVPGARAAPKPGESRGVSLPLPAMCRKRRPARDSQPR